MIEDEDMEQPEQIDKNQYEKEIKIGYLETKQLKNKNKIPRRDNVGNGVEHIKMKFGGKTYDTQLTTRTEGKGKIFYA